LVTTREDFGVKFKFVFLKCSKINFLSKVLSSLFRIMPGLIDKISKSQFPKNYSFAFIENTGRQALLSISFCHFKFFMGEKKSYIWKWGFFFQSEDLKTKPRWKFFTFWNKNNIVVLKWSLYYSNAYKVMVY